MTDLANLHDLAHLHLLLNHFPTIGTILGFALLLLSLVRRNDHLKKASLEGFFIIAVITIPVYESGVAAAEALKDQPGVSVAAIASHQDAALLALIFMTLTGAASWLALWQWRRIGRPHSGSVSAVLLLALLTIAVVARAANIGGDIRHPEILGGTYSSSAASSGSALLSANSVKSFVLVHAWMWPTCETLHFVGMSLMFGVLMIVNLRLTGWLKGMSYASVHRLLPFGVMGFAINMVTGMLFFIAASQQYTQNVAFHWKMILMELAGFNFLALTTYDGAWNLPASKEAPLSGRLLGASALVLSIAVMYFGRMLPFIGNAF